MKNLLIMKQKHNVIIKCLFFFAGKLKLIELIDCFIISSIFVIASNRKSFVVCTIVRAK